METLFFWVDVMHMPCRHHTGVVGFFVCLFVYLHNVKMTPCITQALLSSTLNMYASMQKILRDGVCVGFGMEGGGNVLFVCLFFGALGVGGGEVNAFMHNMQKTVRVLFA